MEGTKERTQQGRGNLMGRPSFLVGTGIVMIAVLVLVLYFYADRRLQAIETGESTAARLDRHYAFISEDASALWETVYGAAEEEAKEHSAYLEWIGRDSPVVYSISDCMRIATASKVDGIILHKAPDDRLTALINQADEEGIPVVMLFDDDSDSSRISYVGMSNYQIGEIYARQILECLKEGTNRILVIAGTPVMDTSMNLLYSQMVRVTEEERQEGQSVQFDVMEVNAYSAFDAEEAIRDVFVRQTLPDIIVCLDLETTECVSQALVDYNEVGNVSVIGFYASDTVSEAVSRGIIYSTLGIDAEQIGRLGVDALEEYFSQGRVSSYFNVGLSVLNAENIGQVRLGAE